MHFVQSRCKGIRGWGEKGKGGVRKGKGGVRRERWRCVERSEFCCGM